MPGRPRDAEPGTAPGAHAELSAPAPGTRQALWGAEPSHRAPTSCCGAGARPPVPCEARSLGSWAARAGAPRLGVALGLGPEAGAATALDAAAEQPVFVSLGPAADEFGERGERRSPWLCRARRWPATARRCGARQLGGAGYYRWQMLCGFSACRAGINHPVTWQLPYRVGHLFAI